GGSVVIEGTRVAEVGSTADIIARHPDADVLDATGCIVTPGLVNAHQHLTGDPLVRCCIPDHLVSDESIFGWVVPIHEVHGSDDDRLSATVASVEAVAHGVTTLVEPGTVGDGDAVIEAMLDVGVRGVVGVWGWDVEDGPFTGPVDEVLDRQRAHVERHAPDGERLVEGWVSLVGHGLASDELWAGASDLARSLGSGFNFHMSPAESDTTTYRERTGLAPFVHLDRLGVLGSHCLVGHGVWLDDDEVELVVGHDVAVACCPWAYLRLAQGITRAGRHEQLIDRGARVALGCDSANAGDTDDVLRAAALLAGLARDRALDPGRLGADAVFELATIGGAHAIGMGDRIGSLEPGKQADLVVHRTDRAGGFPVGDLAHHLVWGTDGRSVRDVLVAGRRVVDDGRVVTVDETALRHEAAARRDDLLRRAGLELTPRWPDVDAR
ncbi:MAG: amidohydrolase family protein, partial [Actinomycetota bacterium]